MSASAGPPKPGAAAVVGVLKQLNYTGPRDPELKRLLQAYGSAVKAGEPGEAAGEAEKQAVIDYVMGLEGGAVCDPMLVRSFTEAIATVDPPDEVVSEVLTGGGFDDIGKAVFNFMKGMCGRAKDSVEEGTEFIAGQVNAANFRASARPPDEPEKVFGKVLTGLAAVAAGSAILTDYPGRLCHFVADVLRTINNDVLPSYSTMLSNAAGAVMGGVDMMGASSEVISKILVGAILGILVYRTRGILLEHAGTMAAAVVHPDTYNGIFMHTITILRSFGIQADAKIRELLVAAYETFVTKAGGVAPGKSVLEKAAVDAAKDAEAAVPVVPGAEAVAAAVARAAAGAGGVGAALVGPLPGAKKSFVKEKLAPTLLGAQVCKCST
jgi:hypothetical protein